MNVDRITEVLAALAANRGNALCFSAHALLSELCGPDGALAIADEAAFELLGSECLSETLDGVTWYHIERTSILANLDAEDDHTIELMARTVRYLARRQLLVAHPSNTHLVCRAS